MSPPDVPDAAERFAASPLLPRDEAGPVFAEPWQAQAFALAVQLAAAGHFTWTEWTTALGAQLQAVVDRGTPDDGSRYFEHWLAALEQLVTEKQLTDRTALRARQEAWADAYRHTPHGHSVGHCQLNGSSPAFLILFLTIFKKSASHFGHLLRACCARN